jgi:hypothetical protein
MSTIPGKRPKLDIALAKNDDELDQPSHPDEEDTNDGELYIADYSR